MLVMQEVWRSSRLNKGGIRINPAEPKGGFVC